MDPTNVPVPSAPVPAAPSLAAPAQAPAQGMAQESAPGPISAAYAQGGLPRAAGTALRMVNDLATMFTPAGAALAGGRADAVQAFRDAPNAARGAGAYIREGLVGGMSRGMELGANNPSTNAGGEFLKGAFGIADAPSPPVVANRAAGPSLNAPPPLPENVPGRSVPLISDGLQVSRTGNNVSISGDGPPPPRAMQTVEGRNAQLRAAYAPTVYAGEPSSTPSLQRDAPGSGGAPAGYADTFAARALELAKDGTWSGAVYRKGLATAARAYADAAGGDAARANANANQLDSTSRARSSSADTGLKNAQKASEEIKALAEERSGKNKDAAARAKLLAQQRMEALLQEMMNPATTPERRKLIETSLVAAQGKNQQQPQVQATPVFNAAGMKVGERLNERQPDGTWKDVTPPPVPLKDNPRAMAIARDPDLGDKEKRAQLRAMGYN